MKIKKSKRGFTLTELAIVIAVIAILIAVLVPTFISLINKANNSSDEQTVKNMNTALQIDEADNDRPEYLCQVWKILENAGYNPAPTPVYTDNEFYWYKSVNRVVIVSASQSEITFPSEYAGITVTDDTSASISMRLTVAKAAADSINKSALVSMEVGEYDAQAHNYDDNGKCTLCYRSIADDPDHEHTYDEGVVTKEATCTEDGVITYTCYTCRHTETETIAASHTWDEGVVTDVTEAQQSCTVTYTCKVCGATKTAEGEKLDGSEARPYAITGSSALLGSESSTTYYKIYNLNNVEDYTITNSNTIVVSGTVTIDLNGCTLTCTTGTITNNGTLTIKDSNSSGSGAIENTTESGSVGAGTAIKNTGTLTIESGTITGTIYGIYSTAGTVTISGGTVSATNSASSTTAVEVSNTNLIISGGTITVPSSNSTQAIYVGTGSVVNISGGSISGDLAITTNIGNLELNISGGTITGYTGGISIFGGTVNISGDCEINATWTYGTAIDACAGTVTITGGKITGSYMSLWIYTSASVNISGGTFTGTLSLTSSYTVTGGTFSADPTSYVDTQTYTVSSVSGYYTVTKNS